MSMNDVEASADQRTEKKKERPPSSALEQVREELVKIALPQDKLKYLLAHLRSLLADRDSVEFKLFWEVRGECVDFFKEPMPPSSRTIFWREYSELCQEARRLKQLYDEQASFAVEQIELAINALEQDVGSVEANLAKMDEIDFSLEARVLSGRRSFYNDTQKKLSLLNAYGGRINSLRKELAKTDMRFKQKNRLFARLAGCSDKVFPDRKALVKEMSEQFTQDVERFVSTNFSEETVQGSLFPLREEIKALQAYAKLFTLNTEAFMATRSSLSQCWDTIRKTGQERKKEHAGFAEESKKASDLLMEEIGQLSQQFAESSLPLVEAQDCAAAICKKMAEVNLVRDDVRRLKEAVYQLNTAIGDVVRSQQKERQERRSEEEKKRRDRVDALKMAFEDLVGQAPSLDVAPLEEQRDAAVGELAELQLNKYEKQEFQRLKKRLQDVVTDRKEEALLALSEDSKENLVNFREVRRQRLERREEVRKQVEEYRRLLGGSSLNFEKSISYNEMMQKEKERLNQLNAGIKEVEKQISSLQQRQ
ncbi:hypothetical protein JYU14_02360 [Simkania negevensis]|uniref:Uncharacterized protein n=1 Tax=Simkania negevensis TaxID=83561 RepID=A0ABS3ARE7_9BACT|nr:hypothetical protein [Simkania negevensis]